MRRLARRLLHSVLVLTGVSILSFVFLELAPGDFFDEMRLNPHVSSQTITQLKTQYGIDQPLPLRYISWLKSAAKGEWGVSFAYNSPVAPLIWARARNTLLLTSSAVLLTWSIALPWGVYSAARKNGWIDRTGTAVTSALLVTPDLLLALAVLWIALRSRWFPAGGMVSPQSVGGSAPRHIRDLGLHLVAPTAVLVLGGLPVLLRHVRAAMAEVLDSAYVHAAFGHGIPRARILFRHALPAAAPPLVSLFALSFGSLLSASVLVEVIMNWPGIGPMLLEAILGRDVYLVIGAIMFSALFLVGGTLLGDILLFALDPRIRTENMV